MQRSTSRKILTTHVGSLPYPDGAGVGEFADEAALGAALADVVKRQRAIGLDVINEGEYSKGGDWLSYVDSRFDGFEQRPPAGGTPVILQGKDREVFADFYRYASERGTLFYEPGGQRRQARPHWVATGVQTGVIGAYTTYSTCAVDSLTLARDGTPRLAVLNLAGSMLAGVLLAWGGASLGSVLK